MKNALLSAGGELSREASCSSGDPERLEYFPQGFDYIGVRAPC